MLKETIGRFAESGVYPFHMPGHKRLPGFMPDDLSKYDVTELPGFDDLHDAKGIIAEANGRIAEAYGAEESRMLVNGSTCGVIAAICSVCSDGDVIVTARNGHRSAFSGMAVSGARPCYIYPAVRDDGICGQVSVEAVREALKNNRGCKAVFVTSPTYEGIVSDIRGIAEAAREFGAALIVDEAHGAHFAFNGYFPESAVSCGADIVINSLHKTLPCPSQCAAIHCRRGFAERLDRFLAITQTSSPSYIFMTVMDEVIAKLRGDASYFDNYVRLLKDARGRLSRLKNLELLTGRDIDRGRLVTLTNGFVTGGRLYDCLLNEHGVALEASRPGYVIAVTSVADTANGFEKLLHGMFAADERIGREHGGRKAVRASGGIISNEFIKADVVLSPREALNRKTVKRRAIGAAGAGMVSGGFYMPYPPGIPLIAPGERITREIYERYLTGYEYIDVIEER